MATKNSILPQRDGSTGLTYRPLKDIDTGSYGTVVDGNSLRFATLSMGANGGYSVMAIDIDDALIDYGTINSVTIYYTCYGKNTQAVAAKATARTGYIHTGSGESSGVSYLTWQKVHEKAIGKGSSNKTPFTDTFTPQRSSDGKYRLVIGFVNPIALAMNIVYVTNLSVTIDYTPKQISYSFVNWDDTSLKSGTVDYNTAPTAPANPSKPSDVQYDYTFSGWSPAVGAITSTAKYTAQYTAKLRKYTLEVTAGGVGGTVTGGGTYDYGKEATLTATPNVGHVEFVKWTDGVTSATRKVTVTGHATYQAIFQLKKYTVTFNPDNGSQSTTQSVEYGSKATPPANPEKADTAQWNYTFDGWYDSNGNKWTSSTTVTGNVTYTARYSSVVQTYIVRWFNEDGTLLETDEGVPYGTKPVYNGDEPKKEGNAEHSYKFFDWSLDTDIGITPTLGTVYIDIYATFTEIVNTYTVTWRNHDGEKFTTLETDTYVPYGDQPDYNGVTPTRASTVEYDYTFIGWSVEVKEPVYDGTDYPDDTELPTVAGDITYTAVYSATKTTHTVTVVLFNETVTRVYDYGETATFSADVFVGYDFVGWSDGNKDSMRAETVTKSVVYEAIYVRSSIPIKVNREQVQGVYIVPDVSKPDTGEIVYVINGTVPTVEVKTETVDGWHFTVSSTIPANSYPLEKLFINRTRIW